MLPIVTSVNARFIDRCWISAMIKPGPTAAYPMLIRRLSNAYPQDIQWSSARCPQAGTHKFLTIYDNLPSNPRVQACSICQTPVAAAPGLLPRQSIDLCPAYPQPCAQQNPAGAGTCRAQGHFGGSRRKSDHGTRVTPPFGNVTGPGKPMI